MNELNQYIAGNLQAPVWAALLALAVLWSAAAGVGRLLLRERESGFVGMVLGTVVLAAAGLLLPLAVFPGWLSLLLLAPFSAWGLFGCRRLYRSFPGWVWILLLLAGFFTLGSALFPPYSWDEQVYQISLPVRHLRDGGGFYRIDNPYSAFPSLPQFFIMWGLKFGGINIFRLTIWFISLTVPVILWMRLKSYGRLYAGMAVMAMVLSPLWTGCSRSFYQEWFVLLYALAGGIVLPETIQSRHRSILAGVFAGSAVAVKLTGGGAALALAVLLWSFRRQGRVLLVFTAAAVLTAMVFYLRPWICSGDPCYPFGALFFRHWVSVSRLAVAEYHHALGSYRFGVSGIPGVALGWIFAAFNGRIFDGTVTGWQLPLAVLICARAAVLVCRSGDSDAALQERRRWIGGAGAGLTAYIFWALSSQQVRFLLPLLPLAAWGVSASLPVYGRKWGISAGVILLAVTVSGVSVPDFRHFSIAWKNLPAARSNPAGHLAAVSRDPGYMMMLEEVAKLPPDSRLLLLFERRTLYLPLSGFILGDSGFQEKYFTPPPEKAADFRMGLKGFDYLLAGGSPVEVDYLEKYEPWREQMKSLLVQSVRTGILIPQQRIGEYWLFKVKNSPEKHPEAGDKK